MLIGPIDLFCVFFLNFKQTCPLRIFLFFFCTFFLFMNTLGRGNFANGGNSPVLSAIGKQCMNLFGIVLVRFETISDWRNIGWVITLFIFCVAFETLHLTINHLKSLELETAVVMVLKWLATNYPNKAIANIYGTRVNIVIKYIILIPKVLPNKDKKIHNYWYSTWSKIG